MTGTVEKGRTGAGCSVTQADNPRIISSIACFGAYFVYGACFASLGPALPSLANATGKSNSAFGIAFTTRGIGYCTGTLLSAWILSYKKFPLTKEFMTCVALTTTGIATGIIASNKNFAVILVLFLMQGIGFGGIDVMANVCIPELWALRAQPWMQAMHALFGVGAIIGPAMIGSIGYHPTFICIALVSFIPLGGLLIMYTISLRKKLMHEKRQSMAAKPEDVEKATTAVVTEGNSKEKIEEVDPHAASGIPVPVTLKVLIVALYFIYVGIEGGYAGWIPTFALDTGVTASYSQAAYLSSYYWTAITVGRALAIFAAVYVSATAMLRTQLCIISASAIFIVILADKSYSLCSGASWFFGFGMSAVFPLAMTIVADYGYTMDSATTTMFMLASTFGESIVPVCVGLLISQFGASALSYCTVACSFTLCCIYVGMHHVGGAPVPTTTTSTTKDIEAGKVEHEVKNIIHIANGISTLGEVHHSEENVSVNNVQTEIEMVTIVQPKVDKDESVVENKEVDSTDP